MKFLYSVNSYLAYKLNEMFYGNYHYVWAAPNYNCKGINPPSSDPFEISGTYLKDVEGGDAHSPKIADNKTGLIKAANLKLSEKIITDGQYKQIIGAIDSAGIDYFRPLLYVISYPDVKDLAEAAPLQLKAGLFSNEYLIKRLPRDKFDVLSFYKNELHV